MGGGTFDSAKMNQVMSSQYGDLMNGNSGEVNADAMVASMGVDPNNAPEFLTKDYRGLMIAIDNKKSK